MNKKIKQTGFIGLSILTVLAVAGCAKEEPLTKTQVEHQIQTKDAPKSAIKLYKESDLKKATTNDLYRMIFETQGESGKIFDELSDSYTKADKNERLRDNKGWQREQVARITDAKAHLKNAQTLIDYTLRHDSFGADTDKLVDSQKLISNFFTIKLESLEIEYEQLIRHDTSYKKEALEKKKAEMNKITKKTEEEAKKEMSQ